MAFSHSSFIHCMYISYTCACTYISNTCTYVFIRGSSLFILVCTWYIHVCTWFMSVHPVQCLHMVHLCSSWFTSFISCRYAVRTSPVLCRTSFRQCYGTGIGSLVRTQFIEVCTSVHRGMYCFPIFFEEPKSKVQNEV